MICKIVNLPLTDNIKLLHENLLMVGRCFFHVLTRLSVLNPRHVDSNTINDLYGAILTGDIDRIMGKMEVWPDDGDCNFDMMVSGFKAIQVELDKHELLFLSDICQTKLSWLIAAVGGERISIKKILLTDSNHVQNLTVAKEFKQHLMMMNNARIKQNKFPVSISILISKKPHERTCMNVIEYVEL